MVCYKQNALGNYAETIIRAKFIFLYTECAPPAKKCRIAE